jgi:dihydroorotase
MTRILIKNGEIINEGKRIRADLLIEGEKISRILSDGQGTITEADKTIDATGKYLLPGVIDDQVHFREPGLTHKGDIYTESKAAVAGGTTSFMEMPNTQPQTTTQLQLKDKFSRAAKSSLGNYSFYFGATNDNLHEIVKTDPSTTCGIKVFMGASTGNMLVDNPQTLESIFRESPTLVAVHAEDEPTIQSNLSAFKQKYGEDIPIHCHPEIRSEEACYRSSSRAIELAAKHGTQLHILHISTARELTLFDHSTPLTEKRITAEVCTHHIWFDDTDYKTKGTYIKWNPAIKSAADREALIAGIRSNRLDVMATDHAPHTREEKKRNYTQAPSGGPLVQHSLVAALELVHNNILDLELIVKKMCHAPADLFRIRERGYIREGYYADLVLVDTNDPWKVSQENILYKCRWSPFEGTTFRSKIFQTWVNGILVYDQGKFNEDVKGKPLLFNR